ncbi:MAG: FtsX-like permease family protein [Spirochaetes bacterium]|nr:FtsX-like permease family protein [Spirochaetota bacterium]
MKNGNMKMLFSISSKNTLRQPRRSLLLGGAIAFSVLIISLAMGFTKGMEKSVQDNVTLFSAGHILINGYVRSESGRAQNRISDQALAEAVKKDIPQALSVSATAQSQATIVFGSREQQLRLRGVDWSADRLFSGSLILKQGDWQTAKADRQMILGAQSAKRFGLGLGDSLLVRLSTFSGQQNVTEYKLGAVYDDTAAGGMNTVLVPLGNLQEDLNLPKGEFQTLTVFLPDAAGADKVAAQLQKNMTGQGYLVVPAAQARQAGQQASQTAQTTLTTKAGQASQTVPTTVQAVQAQQEALGTTTSTITTARRSAAAQGGTSSGAGSALTRRRRASGAQPEAGSAQGQASAVQAASRTTGTAMVQGMGTQQAPAATGQGGGGQTDAQMGGGQPAGDQARGGFGQGGFNSMNIPEGKSLYRVSTITQLSGQVGAVLGSVKWIGVAIFLIMLMLTATGITNTYRMVLLERTKEIGMMRCIGFHRSQIFQVFLFESAILALAGSLTGILLSYPIGWLIHAIPFNASGELGQALSRGRLVYAPTFGTLLIIVAAVLAASMLAVYSPARKASELQPVEAIRMTA